MTEYIVMNIIRVVLGFSCVLVLLGKVFGYERRKSIVPFAVFATFLAALLTVAEIFAKTPEDAYNYGDDIFTPFVLFIPYFLFKPKKKRTFFLFSFAFSGVSEYFWYMIYSVFTALDEGITQYSGINLVIYCVLYSLILISSFVLKATRKKREHSYILEEINPWLYLCLFVVQFSAYYELQEGAADDRAFVAIMKLISIGLLIGSIIYVVSLYMRISAKNEENEMLLEAELRRYEDTIIKNEEIRRFRHDYINNLLSLGALIGNEKNKEASEYIKDLTNRLENTKINFNTGNYLADAIISDKAKRAESDGNKIEFYGYFPCAGIKNSDVCTILSNLLDNAIEACAPYPPCTIKVTSEIKRGGTVITVSNPVKNRVEIKYNTIKTSKADGSNHGYGIGNVRSVAKKYAGELRLTCEDGVFTAEVLWLMENEGKKE